MFICNDQWLDLFSTDLHEFIEYILLSIDHKEKLLKVINYMKWHGLKWEKNNNAICSSSLGWVWNGTTVRKDMIKIFIRYLPCLLPDLITLPGGR